MSGQTEANKKVVEAYFAAQSAGDLNRGLALLAEDATWWVPGNWEMSGTFTKAQMAKMIEGLNQFDGGMQFTSHGTTAEDDRVAVLAEVKARLKDGRDYHNHVFFQFTIRDGKITRVIEVPDSLKSRQFWIEGKGGR